MNYRWLTFIILIMLLLFPCAAWAKDHSIQGSIQFHKNAPITLMLLTQEELPNLNPGSCSYHLTLEPDAKALKTGSVPFKMDNVPEGSYVLLAYQDLNDSKTLDKKYFFFSEPWGTFRPQRPGMGLRLHFEDLSFKLTSNLKKISIRLTQ